MNVFGFSKAIAKRYFSVFLGQTSIEYIAEEKEKNRMIAKLKIHDDKRIKNRTEIDSNEKRR